VAVAARFLERRDFGLMALVTLAIGLADRVADAGLNDAMLHFRSPGRAQLCALFWVSLGVGACLSAAVAAAGGTLAARWGEPELPGLLCAAGAVFLLAGLGQVSAALVRRELRYGAFAALDLARALASLAAVAALAPLGFGAWALVAGLLAGQAARSLLALALAADLFLPTGLGDPRGVGGVLRFSAYQLGERLVNFAARNADKLLIGTALGTEALGVYSLAYQLVTRPFQLLAIAGGRVLRPLLAALQSDRERMLRTFLAALRALAFVAVPLYAGAFLLADPLVRIVYGKGWGGVASVFRILCPLGMLYAIGNLDGALVVATGQARVSFLWNCLSLVVHAAAVALGLRFGLEGVAGSILVATVSVLLPGACAMRWILVRMPALAYLRCLARPLAYALVMGGAVKALAACLGALPDPLAIGLLAAGGAAVYGALLLLWERPFLLALRGS
jgi:O-antigen/teichoic acid export membrane protein